MNIIDKIKKILYENCSFVFARGNSKGIKTRPLKFKKTTLLGHAINR